MPEVSKAEDLNSHTQAETTAHAGIIIKPGDQKETEATRRGGRRRGRSIVVVGY